MTPGVSKRAAAASQNSSRKAVRRSARKHRQIQMFDAGKFRRTKAQECSRFAAAAVDVDDRLFWSRLAEQWLELASGSEKETKRRRFFGFISGD
jgi:hypothetical protein